MDIWDLTKLVFRRWYVFLPLLVVSVALVLAAGVSVKPDYSATGHVQLIPPAANGNAAREAGRVPNPWPDLGFPALGTAVNLNITQDERVLKDLVDAGLTDSFTVTMAWNTSFFAIEAVGVTPEQAIGTVQRLMKLVSDEVTAQQSQFRVEPQDMITTLALDRGDKVTLVTSKRTRVLIVVAGVGLLVSVAGTIAFDAVLRRRHRRREFDASEEMIGARVPRSDGGRRVSWSPPRAADPARLGSQVARVVPEPERLAEIAPVVWPAPKAPAYTTPDGTADRDGGTRTGDGSPQLSSLDHSVMEDDDEAPLLSDQTLILPLARPTRPVQKQQK